jgi:hypothetical protein
LQKGQVVIVGSQPKTEGVLLGQGKVEVSRSGLNPQKVAQSTSVPEIHHRFNLGCMKNRENSQYSHA